MFLMHLWRIWISSHLSCPRASQVIWLIIISSALLSLNCSDSTVACTFLVLSGSDARIICASPLNGTHTLWWVKSGLWTQGACSLSIVVRTWGHVISSSSSIMHPDGRSSSISRSDVLMPSAVYPSLVVGIASAVLVFQLGSEGLTLTSFFLKLFIYVSFALLCFLLGIFGLLVKRSPLKISRFDNTRRQSSKLVDLFNKLMVRLMSHHNIHTNTPKQ